MTRIFYAFVVGCMLLPLAALWAASDPAEGLTAEEKTFCVSKSWEGGTAAVRKEILANCYTTRQYLRRANSCRVMDLFCPGPEPPGVSVGYCMNFGEKMLITDIRLGIFFAPIL
ncbi:MAG: hypothetical protein HY748_02975 [Elusimicrobia bacterium]|nr:hypothetical protein [Elusimicrobiota bacterium]